MTSNISFFQEMDELNREVREMSDRANEAIQKAVKLIATGDEVLKQDVNRLDKELYYYDNLVEKHCLDVIALYSPVAGDLRTVSTCLKIIEDLNRIGRYAHDIAEVSEVFEIQGHFSRMVNIQHMAELVVEMVHDSIDSFTKRDPVMARELFERDDEVDCLYDTIFREIGGNMNRNHMDGRLSRRRADDGETDNYEVRGGYAEIRADLVLVFTEK